MSKWLFCKKLLYSEVPTCYTWNAETKSFELLKRSESLDGQPNIFKETMIGKIYTIHPNQDECFFLRLLLVNVPGPTSFEHLRTVNGTIHDTYCSAWQALNLLENDRRWDNCINDAWETSIPSKILLLLESYWQQIANGWGYAPSNMARDRKWQQKLIPALQLWLKISAYLWQTNFSSIWGCLHLVVLLLFLHV